MLVGHGSKKSLKYVLFGLHFIENLYERGLMDRKCFSERICEIVFELVRHPMICGFILWYEPKGLTLSANNMLPVLHTKSSKFFTLLMHDFM